jgi:hypothetical protein
MTPESQNNSLLGNGSKQVPVEVYRYATIEELPFLCNGLANTKLGVLLETAFSIRSVQSGYKEEFS